MTKMDTEPPIKLFSYQMPTIFDASSGVVITADWQSKKVVMFNADRTWSLVKDLNWEKIYIHIIHNTFNYIP